MDCRLLVPVSLDRTPGYHDLTLGMVGGRFLDGTREVVDGVLPLFGCGYSTDDSCPSFVALSVTDGTGSTVV